MSGAERTEKSRKLKALINKGVQADKHMSLDEIRMLYKTHFKGGNAGDVTFDSDGSNTGSNAGNAQNPANINNLQLTTNRKNNESENGKTLHTHTQTSSDFSKSIIDWQGAGVEMVNDLLAKQGFSQTLDQTTLDNHLTKFKNYYANREVQGSFLLTEQLRLDKFIAWIIREKPTFANPASCASEIATPAPVIDTKTMFRLGFGYKPCFEGHTPAECVQILQDYRLSGETNEETYQRIMRVGLANCTKRQSASDDFVNSLFASRLKTKQPKITQPNKTV